MYNCRHTGITDVILIQTRYYVFPLPSAALHPGIIQVQKNFMIPFVIQAYGMKMPEAFSYKPPMTAVRSGIKYDNGEAILA
jgi:hypothetical protein